MKVKAVKVEIIDVYNDVAELRQHGENDFSVYFRNADFSVRGTYEEVMSQIIVAELNAQWK